jgi:hypothetical protein
MNKQDLIGYAVVVALVIAASVALVSAIFIGAAIAGAFVVQEDDASSRSGHELIATEIHELRKDVWVLQTAVAPR